MSEGNTSDRKTLCGYLDRIETAYRRARRVCLMDRGIPTETLLLEMRDPVAAGILCDRRAEERAH
jgi:hypothetical protein